MEKSNKLTDKEIIDFAMSNEITMSKWQMKAFVEGEGITRWRRVRQLLLEIESRQDVLQGLPFSKEEALGTIDMLKEEIKETKSEGQKRINRAKIARHEAEIIGLEKGKARTKKELDYFLELIHELNVDKSYFDNFYKIENKEDRDYYIRRLGKQAATEIMAYGRMGSGNSSSILLMNKDEQQAAMQGALTLQKNIDKRMTLIDSKIEQNMALPSNGGHEPQASIQDKSNGAGNISNSNFWKQDDDSIIGKHKDKFEQLQQKANGASKGNE